MKKIVAIFILWVSILLIVGQVSPAFSKFEQYPGKTCGHKHDLPFYRWDSSWYITIAQKGYSYSTQENSPAAFFPFYPLTIKFTHFLFHGNLQRIAFSLSILFAFGAIVAIYQLLRIDFNEKKSRNIVLAIFFFPSAFYMMAVYPESLFIMLAALTLLLARKNKWWLVGIFGAALALTKPYGILLWPTLFLEYLNYRGVTMKNWKVEFRKIFSQWNWAALTLPVLSMIGFIVFNAVKLGDPLAFLWAQKTWGRVEGNPIINLFTEAKINLLAGHVAGWNFPYFIWLAAFFFSIWSFIVSWERTRRSYLVFSALILLVALSTGTITSWYRYMIMGFPIMIGPAIYLQERKWFFPVYLAISIIIFVFVSSLFVRCYPVY